MGDFPFISLQLCVPDLGVQEFQFLCFQQFDGFSRREDVIHEQPMKIIHKEQDVITSFCVNQVTRICDVVLMRIALV